MRVRKLDANGDMTFGHGLKDFFINVADAPAQAAVTRLQLRLGEWWLNTADGTPYETRIVGFQTNYSRDPVIRARILGTPGVVGFVSYSSNLDRNTRGWSVNCNIDTLYSTSALATSLPPTA